MKLGSSSLAVEHLLFVDDILIFCRANKDEARALFDHLTSLSFSLNFSLGFY